MKKISMKGRTHTHQAKAHTSVRQSIVCQEPNEQLKVKWPQYLRSSQQHHPYNFVADQKIAAPSARCSSRALCLSQLMEIPDFPNRKAFQTTRSPFVKFPKQEPQRMCVWSKLNLHLKESERRREAAANRAQMRLRWASKKQTMKISENKQNSEEEARRKYCEQNRTFLQYARQKNHEHLCRIKNEARDNLYNSMQKAGNYDQCQSWNLRQMSIQSGLDDNLHLQYLNEYVKGIEDSHKKIEVIMNRISTKKEKYQSESTLELQEVQNVIRLFDLAKNKLNFIAIDKIMCRLSYLKTLSHNTRLQLYQKSTLVNFQEAENVIAKGSHAEYLYLIVKGSVVKIAESCRDGTIKQYSSSMYDGQFFGYIDSHGASGVYFYEVKTLEKCILLRVRYSDYVIIQSELHNSDLFFKIQALKNLECFQGLASEQLIPFVSLLKILHVPIGDYIIKEGDPINTLFIMIRGSATVTKETTIVRKKTPQKATFSKTSFSFYDSPKSFRQPVQKPKTTRYRRIESSHNKRNYQLLFDNEKQMAFHYCYDYSQLQKGSVLLYRAVMKGYGHNIKPQVSQLSVISTTKDCTVMRLRSEDVTKLPDYLLYPLVRYCQTQVDFDAVDNKKIEAQLLQLERMKLRMCREIKQNKSYKRPLSFRA